MSPQVLAVLGMAGALAGAADAQVTLDIRASRTSGVAPLAVFFDASNTTGLAGNDYLQAHFSWDFGDTAGGVWSTTGKSRNTATGFLCAHVFEHPGTYAVTVAVRDRSGVAAASPGRVTITVSNLEQVYAGANTRCVSRTGGFSGAPAGADLVTSTSFADQAAWVNGAANRRLLLRAGETWTGVYARFTGSGPRTVGSFGAGVRPRLVLGVDPGVGQDDANVDLGGTDWRVMDLELDGTSLPVRGNNGSGNTGVGGTENLCVRLDIHDAGNVGWGCGGTGNYLFESAVKHTSYFGIYACGVNNAIMGCAVDQMRIAVSFLAPAESRNMYIAHNLVDASRDAPTTAIKWHSRRGVITDNVLTAGTSRISSGTSTSAHDWSNAVDRNLGIVLIERNVLKPDGNPANDGYTSTGIGINNNSMVARNNLLYEMNMAFQGDDSSLNTHIYHNTVYMSPHTTGLNVGHGDFINASTGRGWDVRNNVVLSESPGSNGTGELAIFGATAGLTMTNNVYCKPSRTNWFSVNGTAYTFAQWQALGMDAGSRDADPLFVSVDTASPSFFLLQSGSPARGAGTAVPVFEDFNRNPRPLTGAQDAGAFVYGSAASVRDQGPPSVHAASYRLTPAQGPVFGLDGRLVRSGRRLGAGVWVVGAWSPHGGVSSGAAAGLRNARGSAWANVGMARR